MLYIVGALFIALGLIIKIFPPKKTNYIYGYRTNLSMKNEDTWNVAQKYSANSMIILGIIYAALEFILSGLIKNIATGYRSAILLIGIIAMLIFDEIYLRKIFNNDGSRK